MKFVSWLPADGEIPPTFFQEIIGFDIDHEIIIPYPVNSFEARSFPRAILSKIFRSTINFIFNIKLKYQNGNNIYPLQLIKDVEFQSSGFLIHLEILLYCLKNKNAKVSQVPFKLSPRGAGESKAITFKNISDITLGILKLKRVY